MSSSLRYISSNPKTAAIIGCPFSGGQSRAGVDIGPIRLVEAGLPQQLEKIGWNVKFDGHHQFEEFQEDNDPPIGIVKNPKVVSAVCERVAQVVSEHISLGELAVTLGGDHSLAMGTISGSLATFPNVGIIWVDAHADLNTIESTDTGHLHGMPVSFLLGLNDDTSPVMPLFSWIKPDLKPSAIVYIGLRDVDEGEKKILREHGIRAFSMHEVDKYGIGKVVDMALDHLNGEVGKRDRPIHLSFDVDALDPSVAPSTGTPVRGGLTFREGHYICEAVHETGSLVALDLMEVNPTLADAASAKATVAIGCSLVRAALGESLV